MFLLYKSEFKKKDYFSNKLINLINLKLNLIFQLP